MLLGYSKHSLYINTKFKGEMIMLKITKSRSLQGTIEIEGVQVVQLSASITIDPDDFTVYNNGGVNRTILNTDLYRKNISTIRQEIAKFEDEVYLMEDEMLAASKVELEE